MYKRQVLLFTALSFETLAQQKALKLDPETPVAGKKLEFKYNTSETRVKLTNPGAVVVIFDDKGKYVTQEPTMEQDGNKFKGTVELPDNTTAVSFMFEEGSRKDNNARQGYFYAVNTPKGVENPVFNWVAANYYKDNGPQLNDIMANKKLSNEYAGKMINQPVDSLIASPFYVSYWNYMVSTEKERGAKMVLRQLENLERSNLTEDKYTRLIRGYRMLQLRAKADSLQAVADEKYPNADRLLAANFRNFLKEAKTPAEILAFYEKNKAAIKPATEAEYLGKVMLQNAVTKAGQKNEKSIVDKALALMEPAQKASYLNSTAWNMAESGKDLATAEKFAAEATGWAVSQTKLPYDKRPENSTKGSWDANRNAQVSMYADTYGYIKSLTGDKQAAYEYAALAAKSNDYSDAEINDRYLKYATAYLVPQKSLEVATDLASTGNLNDSSYALMEKLYVSVHRSKDGYDALLAKTKAAAKEKKLQSLMDKMINIPAASFKLSGMEGNLYTSEMFDGKVSVLDFWATWCGPCIRSMPGMQKAVNKYANYPDVQFFFINTWEQAEDKVANASAFIKKKGYNFKVLMDTKDRMVEDYGVAGIPAKFIIDKKGNIRFEASGFSGSDEQLVEELDLMIELASKN